MLEGLVDNPMDDNPTPADPTSAVTPVPAVPRDTAAPAVEETPAPALAPFSPIDAPAPLPYGSTEPAAPLGYPAPAAPYDFSAYGPPPSDLTPVPSDGSGGGRRAKSGLATTVIVSLLVGGLAGAGGYAVANRVDGNSTTTTVVLPQSDAALSERPSDSIAGIAKAVLPSVVSINFQGNGEAGTGSGSVIKSNGYILTNNHVVANAAQGGSLSVTFQDGSKKSATIVGRDPGYDLAVIKVDATGLPAISLGNSDNVVVGDEVIAIGSPLGLTGTVTSGIISALNRPVTAGSSGTADTSFINAIQTDAAINPGNSGGPLINARGQAIGVNSAIASLGQGGESGSIGVGFAIPINQAKRIAEELISTGKSTRPVIGVQLDLNYTGNGAKVTAVTAGGAAQKAGLKVGDVITAIDGAPVADSTALIVRIRSLAPGASVKLTVDSGGTSRDVNLTLGSDSSSG